MKQLLQCERLTSLLLAMLVSLCVAKSYAATDSDAINSAILAEGSIQLTWDNDETYPWTIEGDWMKSGNVGHSYSKSSLAFSYSSEYHTEITFDWFISYSSSSYHWVRYYVDGAYMGATTSSSYNKVRFYLPKGTHVIEIQDSIANSTNSNCYAGFKNVKVSEIKELETAVLSERSMPLTFTNDDTYPWTTENGYVQSTNYDAANTTSSFSTTFTIDKQSKFSFERRVGYNTSYHGVRFYINGNIANLFSFDNSLYDWTNSATSWGYVSIVLPPGTYTMRWEDYNTSSSPNYYTQVRNIELNQDWVDVEVSTPGTLGVETLYKVDVLTDVELLKVKGTINDDDWATIKQMTNLHAADLSEAKFDAMPDEAFYGRWRLSTVSLPEGMTSIGASAFYGTNMCYLMIPSTVIYIGDEAFSGTPLRAIYFPDNSELSSIGYQAFYECSNLMEFIMPNTVTTLYRHNHKSGSYDSDTFYNCTSLRKLKLSDGLTTIPQYTCYGCFRLSELTLPANLNTIEQYGFYDNRSLQKVNLPESLQSIGNYAFAGCATDSLRLPLRLTRLGEYAFKVNDALKYIELPSYVSSYNYTFYSCGSIETVVCPSATPPAISKDPFYYCNSKSSMTLKVPSFAVVNYKLDSYWYQFGSIVEGDDISYWKISGDLSLTNNRRMNGKPDIDLMYGGTLTVGGNAPMEVGMFNVYMSEGSPSRLLNDCVAFTADSIATHFSASANTWYFFTPMTDVDLADVQVNNTASFVFRYYDGDSRASTGTGSSWKNVTDSKLYAGQGYIFQCNAASVVSFPVKAALHSQILSTDAVELPLTAHASDNAANKGWNYVGNPYPCYFDIYYMDFTAPITVWTGSTYRAYSITDDNYVLRPMQGFFVQKPDAVDAIVMQTQGKQLASTVNRASYAPALQSVPRSRTLFNIEIASDSVCDMTRVVLNEGASLEYEIECDATKFMSMDAQVAQIYTIDDQSNRLAINERPESDGIIRLGVYVDNSERQYTISASRCDGEIYLHDLLTNQIVDLTYNDYSFTSDINGNIDDRFTLHAKPAGTSGIEAIDAAASAIKVVSGNGYVSVMATANGSIAIYSIDGRLLMRAPIASGINRFDMAAGVYVVKAGAQSIKTIVK